MCWVVFFHLTAPLRLCRWCEQWDPRKKKCHLVVEWEKTSNTIWFSLPHERKIKWFLYWGKRLTWNTGAILRKSRSKSEQQYHLQLSFAHVCMESGLGLTYYFYRSFGWIPSCPQFRVQWHYMQSNTWLWFDVQSNCIPFQWKRKFNSNPKNVIASRKRRKRRSREKT